MISWFQQSTNTLQNRWYLLNKQLASARTERAYVMQAICFCQSKCYCNQVKSNKTLCVFINKCEMAIKSREPCTEKDLAFLRYLKVGLNIWTLRNIICTRSIPQAKFMGRARKQNLTSKVYCFSLFRHPSDQLIDRKARYWILSITWALLFSIVPRRLWQSLQYQVKSKPSSHAIFISLKSFNPIDLSPWNTVKAPSNNCALPLNTFFVPQRSHM